MRYFPAMQPQQNRFPGSNAERSRLWNRAMVLGQVRAAGAMGRAAIARASGLTTQTVSNIIAELEAEGLLSQVGLQSGRRGKPAAQYAVLPSGGHALGVELRPDAARAVLTDLSGQPVWSARVRLESACPEAVARVVLDMRDGAALAVGLVPGRLLGLGVVMPGPFGRTGLVDAATELPGWEEVAPRAFLEERLSLPVLIENDANCAAIAERHSGVARGLHHYAFVYFGAGLGLGIVAGGTLLRGAFGNAGEIGHVNFGEGPLQQVASRLALARRLGTAGVAADTVEEIEAALDHPETERWLVQAGNALAPAVATIENLFDPETVVLGGALPDALIDRLIGRIGLSPRSLSARPDRSLPRLMRGASGRMTAAMGAAALVVDQLFTPRLEAV